MSEGREPAPDFDHRRYERPQKDWVCGRACNGCPCRLGPSPSGECRAGAECAPVLVVPEGQTKGLWKCTRPASEGGACPEGPRPDGACCRTTSACRPARSLRARRGLVVRAVIAACLGLILLAVAGPWRGQIISPGALTPAHSSVAFAITDVPGAAGEVDAQGCAHCHPAAHQDPSGWAASAVAASVSDGPLSPSKLLGIAPRDFGPMDAACQSCHRPHSFHQANIEREMSCSVCHLEHQGRDRSLLDVDASACVACHGDSAQMSSARLLAHRLPAEFFEKKLPAGQAPFSVPRPHDGRTARITSFADDHPEFRLHAPGSKDTNPLAFNHALHLSGDRVPALDGRPLDCRSCHEPDASGKLMKPVSFALHCQSCHGLPIDPSTPAVAVPHGSPEAARAFLRALPAAYSDDAVRRLGLSGEPLRRHVEEKLVALKRLHPSGEALERKVFFGDPAAPAGRDSCNLCHRVEASPAGAAPRIAPVKVPDIWLPHARFDHSRHTQVSCQTCHAATRSSLTTDIILPSKNTCAACHGPSGGVTDSCTACHGYHNPPPAGFSPKTASTMPEALRRAIAPAAP